MKINFVLPPMGTSGGIDIVYKYVELLSKHGYNVCVYREILASNMHRYPSEIKNVIHQLYCTLKALFEKEKWKRDKDVFVFKLTNNSVRDADFIIATAWPTAYRISHLPENKGKKYYFIQDYEIWDNSTLVKSSYKLPLKKIVISSWINNCLKKDLGIGPFPVVYNGLDLETYHQTNIRKENGTINFLMLNHYLFKKGIKNGIKAFEKIKNEYKNCRLRMFGMCNNDNLPGYVDYYQNPSKKQLVELYSMSDIFLFPSIDEGWGLTPLEAMACGCIVIGTNTGFALDLGLNGYNMMISAPNDVNQMVSNIRKVLNNSTLANNIRKNGYKTVGTLNWEDSVNKFENLLLNDKAHD